MTFTVRQNKFEGPYHKLLELIEARKLLISEFSLAQIADEYISYIQSIEEKEKGDMSQFIVIASTLMLIKAKSLLPAIEYTSEEKKDISELESKLRLYKVLSDNAKALQRSWSKEKLIMNKDRSKIDEQVFAPGNLSQALLQSVSILTIVKFPKLERLRNVAVLQAIKLEDVIQNIMERIQKASEFTLKSFATSISNVDQNASSATPEKIREIKSNIIVSFLAILTLIKGNMLSAEQTDNHGDIVLKKI
jgi:segregation and condensation protein A